MWVALTLAAGILQSTRNALAHSLAEAIPPVLIAAVVYSISIFGERGTRREIPEMAVISAGILLVLLGGAPR